MWMHRRTKDGFTVWKSVGPEGRPLYHATRDREGIAVEPGGCSFTRPSFALKAARSWFREEQTQ